MNCTHIKELNLERFKDYDAFQINFIGSEPIVNMTFRMIIRNRLGAIVKEFKQDRDIKISGNIASLLPYKESLPAGDYNFVFEYTTGALTQPVLVGEYKVIQI